MKTNYKNIIILLIIVLAIPFISPNMQYFPEDFTDMDYLVNAPNEVFIAGFYFTDPMAALPGPKYDYRNGIIINPMNDVNKILTTNFSVYKVNP